MLLGPLPSTLIEMFVPLSPLAERSWVDWHDFPRGDKIARDEFFTRYWSVLEPFEPCYHWGKALPPPTPERIKNLTQRFPGLSDFLQLRQTMDPDGRFLTEYWRKHLGIP